MGVGDGSAAAAAAAGNIAVTSRGGWGWVPIDVSLGQGSAGERSGAGGQAPSGKVWSEQVRSQGEESGRKGLAFSAFSSGKSKR